MKILSTLLILLLLSGCGMTTEEAVKEVNKCKEAGLVPKQFVNNFSNRTTFIRCDIPLTKKGE